MTVLFSAKGEHGLAHTSCRTKHMMVMWQKRITGEKSNTEILKIDLEIILFLQSMLSNTGKNIQVFHFNCNFTQVSFCLSASL